jgi:xanthine dehydrogenase small subunit
LVRKSSRKLLPALYDMLAVFGSRQIREQGTIGGNVANASPIGDMPPILMALEASVVLRSVNGSREMKLSDFITGYRQTALAANELITQVIIPLDQKGKLVKSYKISKRKDLDISTVSGGFWLKLTQDGHVEDIALIYGGMAAMTKHAANAENYLRGKAWSRENIDAALDKIDQDFSPISDARSGKEGRRIMARNLLLKFWADTTKKEVIA